MFKLESYIAPILLSYVDKYIKNFRLEDSQVSLWGGDASFQNLDLRLEVLEQDLQSPFSFISGHIRELSIHVPWTKLTSEPITITINTIECVLKLKDASDGVASDSSSTGDKHKRGPSHKLEDEAPPNYVQLLINKIVSNIRIFCNNVILKYVEEDIVLSMNVKHLKVESCNEKWEPSYIDILPTQVVMRKIISVNDLTVCLDKRNASGKIDFYQEPMLYRCSMTMHMLRTYHSSTINKTSLTRLDIYCNNMEFSVTEQQVPMFIRLIVLLQALNQKQLPSSRDLLDGSSASQESKEGGGNSESWSGWAWSYVSSVLPTQWDEDLENQQLINQSGHIKQIGFYVDNAFLIFKVSETSYDKGYYSQKKVRYYPLLVLQLQGIYSEVISVGRKWFNATCGIGSVLLMPVGSCSCSYPESNIVYLQLGRNTTNHTCNSLFDENAVENRSGQYRTYNTNWDFHMFTNTNVVMLERTPALSCDYLYQMELPEGSTSDILSELGSNLEYSNMAEKAHVRVYVGPLKFNVCSGFFHRTDSLKVAAASYDYPPYYVLKPEPPLQDLLPPSEEDFDALNEFIPTRTVNIMMFQPVINLYFMDHPIFEPTRSCLFKRAKKLSTSNLATIQFQKLPKVTVECKSIDVTIINPMYTNRLIHTTCQLPDPPKNMFERCFSMLDIDVVGLCSRLILKETNCTNLVVPLNLSYQSKSIFSPQYWINPDIRHNIINFQLENVTFNCTKPKLIVVSHLLSNLCTRNTDGLKTLRYTSLLYDACKDYAMPYLELNIEGVRFKKINTNSTISIDIAFDSVKAFVFESTDNTSNQMSNIQQVLFLSGPEPKVKNLKKPKMKTSVPEDSPLFVATIQYPVRPELQPHPSLVIFNSQEINVCVDPLVCKWLIYHPIDIAIYKSEERFSLRKISYDLHGSVSETPRRTGTQIESVHSSSDRDVLTSIHQKLPTIDEVEESVDLQEQIYDYLKTWHPVWKCIILNGHISQCVLYFPMASISAVGAQSIEDAIKESLKRNLVPNVMVITLPSASIHSAQKQNLAKFLLNLPVKLPESSWNIEHSSFPWTMSISDLNCYSMEAGKETSFLKTVGINATVGLSTKVDSRSDADSQVRGNSMGSLGVYVHIDVTPVLISVSEAQMYLLARLIYGLADFVKSLTPKNSDPPSLLESTLPSLVTVASPSMSPTVKDNTLDNTSGTIAGNDLADNANIQENVKLTAWIQWTITKFSVELFSQDVLTNTQLKLVIDIEDIVSSLDYQNVYLKLKKKIGSVSIHHYKRSNEASKWSRGPFSGVAMRLREDVTVEKRSEDGGFIGITVTRASSQHTHNLWGTVQKNREKRPPQTSRYLTEIVVTVQPVDVILSMKALISFSAICAPFLENCDTVEHTDNAITTKKRWFTNQNLPLAYLECHEIRVVIPSSEIITSATSHDVIVVQVEKISLNPSVANPICRAPVRSDIYRQAAQARVLTIPGSELEDRQYQFDVVGMSVSTTTWKDLETVWAKRGNLLSENPALEWNNLKQGKLNIAPMLNMRQLIEKFDVSVVAAPPMVYKNDIVICSSSFEVNFVTDIAIYLSLDQLKLASMILNEFSLPTRERVVKASEISYPFTKSDILNSDLETELTEFYKDSGIDTSEIRSVLSARSQILPIKPNLNPLLYKDPSEILFTAGKISFCLYQISITYELQRKKHKYTDEDERNYEASEEESVDEVVKKHKTYIPLLYLFLAQPNVYSSTQQFANTTHISCFDFGVKLASGKSEPLSAIPTAQDFAVDLICTRSGCRDHVTGIPPAFFTLKYTKEHGKNTNYHIDMCRPTKIAVSATKIMKLLSLKSKIIDSLSLSQDYTPSQFESPSNFRLIKEKFKGIDMIQFKTDQLVFLLENNNNLEATFILNKTKSRLFSCERPEKIQLFVTLECMTFSVTSEDVKRLLLNPWTVSLEATSLLESWQGPDSDPLNHVSVDSDCIMVDISPEQIVWLEQIVKEITEFSGSLSVNNELNIDKHSVNNLILEKDQHYKDDLRAGAFQFIEAGNLNTNGEELPLPYQVMFWNFKELNAMAWRYPQPRALTKVRIFPVPLEASLDSDPINVTCTLQYWSDHHCAYISYADFNLSESEVCYLDLPKTEPLRAVAYIWRVTLNTCDIQGKTINRSVISARALAACMRIDSYFNKSIVPNFTLAVYVSKIELSLVSTFNKTITHLPVVLKQFSSDQAFPETHCFFKATIRNIKQHMASWDNKMVYLDVGGILRCTVLDYMFLTDQCLFEQFTFKCELNLAKKLEFNFIAKPIQLFLGPTITHTLIVNSQLWSQVNKSIESREFVIFTRYVICNDTNKNLRFGQASTDEDLLLPCCSFHLYCWRSQKFKRKLKVALPDRGLLWSKPFSIDEEGTEMIPISLEHNLYIIVTVKALSKTQKQIKIAGQFVIANMLLEHFEFKVIPESKDDKELKKLPVHVLRGKTVTPSMFVDYKTEYYFRLRFYGLESAWTGDIPLKEHTKGAQPWLVKVPLQERGQFLSIWCRIVAQDCQKGKRILAMLWPLFMVKSNLPITSNIHIETPTLNVHLDSTVKGKGELQQLYCPGTIDHSHQLTFKLDDGTSISDPYIPLNYSLVDQQKFFKKTDKENIDDILESLQTYDLSKWPYFGEDLENIDWVVDEQPQTTIQVRYQNACQYSSTLSVELIPWCLMINTFGCSISLMTNGIELCSIPQHGIVAPPKLDNNFNLGIDIGTGWFYSSALQLSTSDWSQTFYMPKITGTLSTEGTVKTAIKCEHDLAMVSITSTISDQIRLLKVSSTHVLCNYMMNQIHVICVAVPEGNKMYSLPQNAHRLSFSIAPQSDKTGSGISIIRWCVLEADVIDPNMNYVLYMSFCCEYEYGWSCPVRVDDNVPRRSISLKTSDNKSIPLVLTSHERKGQVCLSVYQDDCPQTLIQNRISANLVCAQALGDSNGSVACQSKHFDWFTSIEAGSSTYYTMPFVSEKFPELPQSCFAEKIVFALERKSGDSFDWSLPTSITNDSEQYIKIPNFGDVKLFVKATTYTTLITLESVSEVEISALDIRGRLSRLEVENFTSRTSNRKSKDFIIESYSNSEPKMRNDSSANSSLYKSLFVPTISKMDAWNSVEILVFVESFSVGFLKDYNLEKEGIASIVFDGIGAQLREMECLTILLYVSDIQFDNELYMKESFDFPVVLVSQETKHKKIANVLEQSIQCLLEASKEDALLKMELVIESWVDSFSNKTKTGVKEIKLKFNPISVYIEDIYVNKLLEYFNNLLPMKLVFEPKHDVKISGTNAVTVNVPALILWESSVVAKPLSLKTISIESLSLLLSVHSSLKMYIALDQSPLQFAKFERRRFLTTPYRLGHAMTMHYLSGAIFGAGWVVSSLELLGSPSGLARAMGIGLRDFINLPYRGLIQGPWAFLSGVTHGSASLMRHVTAGTLQSVTKLASSVARNLDRLTLDEEHLRRTEEQRRMKPQGVTQGFMLGLTGLGISLLGAVGGIAHHPLQSIMADGASPRSLAAGVGLGLVGVITKPLSGAAELVALTGQGILQGAGWNPLPQPRTNLFENVSQTDPNSTIKYEWKLLHCINSKNVLYVTEATVVKSGAFKAVALVLTNDATIIVNIDDDEVQRIISSGQLQVVISDSDPTYLLFKVLKKAEGESVVEMDSACRARVADYVKNTASLLLMGKEEGAVVEAEQDNSEEFVCYVNPQNRNYFVCLMALTKQLNHNYSFPVL